MFTEQELVETLADTAASHHYLQDEAKQVCTDIQVKAGPPVTVSNDNTIAPHSEAKIYLSTKFSDKAQHVFLFDNLKTGSLISIGKLCDDDCIAIFFKYQLKILKKIQSSSPTNVIQMVFGIYH